MNLKSMLEEKLTPIAYKLATNKVLIAIRNGLALSMPLVMAGSLLMIIASFPVQQWKDWLKLTGIATYLWKGVDSSFGLVSLVAAFGIAYDFAKQHDVDGISAGIISIGSFITLTPFVQDKEQGMAGVPTKFLGASGLFVAIIIALLSTLIFIWFIKRNIIPGIVIISAWLVLFAVLEASGLPNLHLLIQEVLGKPVSLFTNNLLGTCVVAGLNGLSWFVGVHGADTVLIFKLIWMLSWPVNPYLTLSPTRL